MDFINDLMYYHPIIFKVLFGTAGLIIILILISILQMIRDKIKLYSALDRLDEAEKKEKELEQREERLEERIESRLEEKYQKKRKKLKNKANRKLKKEIVKVTGLPIEDVVRKYGKLIKNDELNDLWDI